MRQKVPYNLEFAHRGAPVASKRRSPVTAGDTAARERTRTRAGIGGCAKKFPHQPLRFPAVATPPALLPIPICAEDFDVLDLLRHKEERGLTISVCLPARDEEATVGQIVATVRRTLMEAVPLVDEVVVLDDGSIDSTADVAAWEGARVIAVDDVLPESGPGSGKGNAMWKSLHATNGDLVCWVDADIRNFGHHFISGLLGPHP